MAVPSGQSSNSARILSYLILTILAIFGYALLVSGLSLVFGGLVQPTNPLLVGFFVVILALLFNPARRSLQRLIDHAFSRSTAIYRQHKEKISHELASEWGLDQILLLLRRDIDELLMPACLHIYIRDPLGGQFVSTKGKDDHPTSDVRFQPDSTLVSELSKRRYPIFWNALGALPSILEADRARLALLGAQLFVPLPGRDHLMGWFALGPRSTGEAYQRQDLDYLGELAQEAVMAIERAQVVADLERRVRETNVLTRIAQGVSFTLSFDDILELIFAQTNLVLPTRDFRVTLYDPDIDGAYHVFYLDDDERLAEKENALLPPSQGLEMEVIHKQRSLVTEDYERECRLRGLLPGSRNLYAWMGVPLNAGAKTIGVMSLGSRDPGLIYHQDQCDLLQAIADQASGAIVKARLLQESENRAHQLASLNEIAMGLTSNLELKPLLNQILESATQMLSCGAGCLFLLDQETGDLVFEVVLGSVAEDLVGRRLLPGTGMVGEAVTSGKPVIANDVKRRKQHFEQTDQQTGFDTQDVLVMPMRIHEQVIGVIEVINKINGAPFNQADQDLLMAFTSQATIAIENARLYTLTDQALAARVEELSVMQRIDRELNASLEIDSAMRITLDWAMRQSKVEAGFVGTVNLQGVQVMTAQGYSSELQDYQPSLAENGNFRVLPVKDTALEKAIQTGQPQCVRGSGSSADGGISGVLEGAQLQIVIPIRRETNTIGLIVLESTCDEPCASEMVEFLSRLADHAAIAIANAQLYEEVREANQAKSRFVSFVAHELKNPMASIKGYTELVAGGVAGPVSDMQKSFLNTVRTNVDRMNTIVSDLNDLTKIQVGNLRLEYHTIQVARALDEVTRSLKSQIDEKEQQLELRLSEDLPAVWADPVRLTQIFTNLLSNATKYTPVGGQIFIGAERLTDEHEVATAEQVHVWVKDTGIGIPEDEQAGIFQEYYRTEEAKEMASGTGLGLKITRSLVEMQGGRIWFESQQGVGTTFHFTIPLAETP